MARNPGTTLICSACKFTDCRREDPGEAIEMKRLFMDNDGGSARAVVVKERALCLQD